MTRLRHLLTKFRRQIRADLLSEYRVDLAAEMRTGRYLRLLELIEELPMACRWREAAQMDPDYISQVEEMVLAQMERGEVGPDDAEEGTQWRPSVRDFRVEHLQNNKIIGLLGDVLRALGNDLPDDYVTFPVPYDPEYEARIRAQMVMDERRIENALAKLFSSIL